MPRILVVEDNPDLREMLTALLKSAGYGVITAENGQDAFVRAAAEAPALIITDLEMPELNGIDMIRRFRAEGAQLGGVPIIALSAYDGGLLDRASDAGASAWFRKPVQIDALFARIEELLGDRRGQPIAKA